ncbi:peptidyl-prolyl cis-trans isomerase FKBP2-like [Ornithodoros turicata]|uniref:peptidyl-prolyl cis-trans isomerase FKBP2-like n=1 Tax=Ornithodoros turicata TaxID=34597 RepID=UPI0031395284
MRPLLVFALFCSIHQLRCEELKIDVTKAVDKCERKSKRNDLLSVHYTGKLQDGTEFDSSHARKEPFKFQIGVGQVVKGWDQGLLDMCVGEHRTLTVPPELGYGDKGAGDRIKPKSTLIFDVELVKIEDGPPPVNVFKQIDSDKDDHLSREEVSKYLKEQLPAAQAAGLKDLPETDKMVEDIFQHEDRDRDGLISKDEFSGPKHDEL